jgi:hypothetical protein
MKKTLDLCSALPQNNNVLQAMGVPTYTIYIYKLAGVEKGRQWVLLADKLK